MTVRRVVPDLTTGDMDGAAAFYTVLGLREVMRHTGVRILASPDTPAAQVLLFDADTPAPSPDMSIEVAAVDAVHAEVIARGATVVYALRDEPWGVRRFFVRDPDGRVVNVLSHR